jgi:NAD(P)-dependent dehydrogenase (short-subunit alcohol dehydrogenase family)
MPNETTETANAPVHENTGSGAALPGAIVTGGGSGLGRAAALDLARHGRALAIWDIDELKAKTVADEVAAFGFPTIGLGVDVGDRSAVRNAAATSREAIGLIGALACCAGIVRHEPVGGISEAGWGDTLHVNLSGTAYTVEALIPYLREVGRGAAIVTVASTEALRGNAFLPAYSASKHAVLGMTRSYARALGGDGIRVNVLCPGAMDTPMLRTSLADPDSEVLRSLKAAIPLGRISDPAEVAPAITFLLSAQASYITGASLLADGGLLS